LRRLTEFKQKYYIRLPAAEKNKLDELIVLCNR